MGKLLDYINKQLKIIRDLNELEKTNAVEARSIKNSLKIFDASQKLDNVTEFLNGNAAKYF